MAAMNRHDPRVDAYIAKCAEFSHPILNRVRELVLAASPQIEETLKWSAPSYTYKGKILCHMAAFKQHVSFGFWQHALVVGEGESGDGPPREGAGSFGRMTTVDDVPSSRKLTPLFRKAMLLIDEGVPSAGVRKTSTPKPPPETPPELAAALKENAAARRTFEAFAPSHKREYVDWITEAKREETRQKRVAQAVEWLAEGKQRHWKYQNC
jgi:uncharacterized protein YdeI (YjbR/CyaY-like superfamily)